MSAITKILIVDDVEENLVALEALLRRDDAQIILAHSGTQALELVLVHEFALALVDVQMPEMDGFELAELMRGAERSKYIPIIFVTAGAGDAQRVFRGYESGAVDFLFKPVDPLILRQKTNTFIQLHQQRRQLAEQLERVQESEAQLAQAVQAREDVLAVVSHDVRNFLQSIRSGVSLLAKRNDSLDEEMRDRIYTRLRATVDLMTRMIADLMDMANIRAGRISVTLDAQHMNSIVHEAVAAHEPLAEEKGIRLSVQLGTTDEFACCDRERVLQVLANLLGNAIKFCGGGGTIVVRTTVDGEQIHLCVADSGCGIAAADLPFVFEAYWSGKNALRSGTGLGLYITRRIIEAHGGRIWIESTVGQGATVHFSLPTAKE